MSIFGQYTGSRKILTPWEARYADGLKRGHRGHGRGFAGLGDLGNATPSEIACWEREATYWASNNGYAVREVSTARARNETRWLGTMLCPKPDPWGRHVLYDIIAQVQPAANTRVPGGDPIRHMAILIVRTGFADPSSPLGMAEGHGYFHSYFSNRTETLGGPGGGAYYGGYSIHDAEKAGYARVHSANGIAHKGIGAGSVLYAGLALAAIDGGFKGAYSIEGTRSNLAAMLWKGARNDRSGPLARRDKAAIARNADGSMLSASVSIGDSDHCVDENLSVLRASTGFCAPLPEVLCSTGRVRRQDYVSYDMIDAATIKQWGLMLFNAPVMNGEGLVKRPATEPSPYLINSAWKNDDVKIAFGMRLAPSSLTSQSAAMQRHSKSFSDRGLEILSRAAVGPSVALIVKVAAVLQGRSNDLAVQFLKREDIASVLGRTGAGKSILTSMGVGTPLQGLGKAAFQDVNASAARAESMPTALTLPTISKATEAFITNYPEGL